MAKVTIRSSRDENAIPGICARCGRSTTYTKTKRFTWHPPWLSVLIVAGLPVYIILAVMMTKRRTLDVPLCDKHRWHWLWHPLIGIGGLILCIGLFVVIPATLLAITKDDKALGIGVALTVFITLVWLVVVVVLDSRMIKATEITDDAITLTNVSQKFVDEFEGALESARQMKHDRRMEAEVGSRRSSRGDEEDRGGSYRPDEERCRPRADEDDKYDQPDERYMGK